jgi:hypothetical protein
VRQKVIKKRRMGSIRRSVHIVRITALTTYSHLRAVHLPVLQAEHRLLKQAQGLESLPEEEPNRHHPVLTLTQQVPQVQVLHQELGPQPELLHQAQPLNRLPVCCKRSITIRRTAP